jgi:AraC-like DNA-binding protein
MKPLKPINIDVASGLHIALLPRNAYSVRDPMVASSLGMALERQQGVHAIGTDCITDFDTWPGTMAYTPPGVDVFSESPGGGEYLLVRWRPEADSGMAAGGGQREQWTPHRLALRQAWHLRRLLLAEQQDTLALEQAALAFSGLKRGRIVVPNQPVRTVYRQVLDRIAEEFDQPLTIAQLAAAVHKTPLAFLREFTQLVGSTPHAFIMETRLQAARAMIRHSDLPLSFIAADCGFAHQSHMGLAFRKVLGQTPGDYRASLQHWRHGAIHAQVDAADVGRQRAGQEGDRGSDVFHPAYPAHRHLGE